MKKGTVSIISTFLGAAVGAGATGRTMEKKARKAQNMSDKHLALFLMMDQWVKVKQDGKNLADYFEKQNYKTIAIYGMSYAGERLCEELKNSNITIKYAIDKNAASLYSEVEILSPEDTLEEVDAIIVTPIFFMDEIEEMLSKKVDCPIISLEDILYEI